MNRNSLFATLAGLMSLAGTAPASADVLFIDFEPPTYVLGSINGQDGWISTGPFDQEVVNVAPISGLQSFRISNAITSGSFGDQTFSKSLTDEAGETTAENDGMSGGTRQNHFESQWTFASTVPGAEQPGLSVVASPDRGDGARMSWVQMRDTPTGLEVNFFDYQKSVGDFVFTNVSSRLPRGVPHTIKITMDFVDGPANDIVKVFVDGVLRHTGTSWEDYFRDREGNPTRTVDSILFRVGGPAAPATDGFGFLIDNLTLLSGVPDVDNDGVPDDKDMCVPSDTRSNVDVNGSAPGQTSIINSVNAQGCTIQDLVNACAAEARNHGQYVSCIVQLANDLRKAGVISNGQSNEMKQGAAKSNIGK